MIDEKELLAAIRARRERHGNCPVTLDLLENIVLEAVNPVDFSYKTPEPVKQLYAPPEFPKLKVRCENKQVVEQRVIHNFAEEKELAKSGQVWYTQPWDSR